jgi:hypothetical protein
VRARVCVLGSPAGWRVWYGSSSPTCQGGCDHLMEISVARLKMSGAFVRGKMHGNRGVGGRNATARMCSLGRPGGAGNGVVVWTPSSRAMPFMRSASAGGLELGPATTPEAAGALSLEERERPYGSKPAASVVLSAHSPDPCRVGLASDEHGSR